MVNAEDDVNVKYGLFHEILSELVEECIPTRSITMLKSEPWFITPLIKSLLRKRNKLRCKGRIQQQTDELSSKIGRLITEVKRKSFTWVDSKDTRKIATDEDYDPGKFRDTVEQLSTTWTMHVYMYS